MKPVAQTGNELGFIKFRFKYSAEPTSKLYSVTVPNAPQSDLAVFDNFQFAAAVAELGLLLSNSEYKGMLALPICSRRCQNRVAVINSACAVSSNSWYAGLLMHHG